MGVSLDAPEKLRGEQTMQPEIVVGILSLTGTLIGSLAGIMTSNKLMLYRIDRLEEKVNKHNNLIERMYECEKNIDIIKTEINDNK